jgi:hypothetical protein
VNGVMFLAAHVYHWFRNSTSNQSRG